MDKAWTEFFKKHGRFYLKPHPFFQRIAGRFKTYEVRNVLDLGSGSGRHTVAFAEKGFSMTAVDFSPAAVELTKKWLKAKNLHADTMIADFHKEVVGIGDSTFDGVISINSLHYSSMKQFEDTIKEVNRILKDGGLFWLVLPSKDTTQRAPDTGQILYEEEELKDLLSSTFRILEFDKDSKKSFSILAQEK